MEGVRSIGKKEFEKLRSGGLLTRGEAMKAKCYECMGGYIDGRRDCESRDCPLYKYMPYRVKED